MKLLLNTKATKMSSEEVLPASIPELTLKPQHERRFLTLFRLALGGGICGGFLGIFVGALFGALYGVFVNDISLGLDGSLIGGVGLAVPGFLYGLVHAASGRSEASLPLREEEALHEASER
jgi:hypothetical protein